MAAVQRALCFNGLVIRYTDRELSVLINDLLTKEDCTIMDNVEKNQENRTQDDLTSFREQWKRELKGEGGANTDAGSTGKPETPADQDIQRKARDLFQQGVQLEQSGKLYDAIRYYKKAVALVPDIEYQTYMYNSGMKNKQQPQVSNNNAGDENGNNLLNDKGDNESDSTSIEMVNLITRFSSLCTDNSTLIQPEVPTQATHIGELPREVLNYILKWVVSSDLDLASLEACAEVCRGFYIAARDEEIWRLVCLRIWGPSANKLNFYSQWREMFLSRPRIQFQGCYSSKMSYIREGERSFQDHESYKSWYSITYFRFLRLFPGGRALMVMSAEDPGLVAKLINNRNFCSIQGALFGDFRIVDNILVCVLHRPSETKKIIKNVNTRRRRRDRSMSYFDVPEQDYHIEFYIKNKMLTWKSYNIIYKYSSGREVLDSVNIQDQTKFPRLKFLKVGNYHFEAQAPLKMMKGVAQAITA